MKFLSLYSIIVSFFCVFLREVSCLRHKRRTKLNSELDVADENNNDLLDSLASIEDIYTEPYRTVVVNNIDDMPAYISLDFSKLPQTENVKNGVFLEDENQEEDSLSNLIFKPLKKAAESRIARNLKQNGIPYDKGRSLYKTAFGLPCDPRTTKVLCMQEFISYQKPNDAYQMRSDHRKQKQERRNKKQIKRETTNYNF